MAAAALFPQYRFSLSSKHYSDPAFQSSETAHSLPDLTSYYKDVSPVSHQKYQQLVGALANLCRHWLEEEEFLRRVVALDSCDDPHILTCTDRIGHARTVELQITD